jgi:MATE family multidrug resistance protein
MNQPPLAPPAPLPKATLRTLLALAWPVVLARSSQSVVSLSDALMVAPLGEAALAATTTGAMNTFAFIILPMGTVFIVQSFAAQLFGRGDLVAARRYAWYGLILAAMAMLVSLVASPLVGPTLRLFRFTPEVHDLQTRYIAVRLWSLGAIVGVEALGNWFAGLGNTRIQMRASLVTMVSNVFLNWVFIYGKLGAPSLGVTGAALANTIASWLGLAVVAFVFVRHEHTSGVRGKPLALRVSELVRMVRFGLPNGINWFMEFGAFLLFINAIVAPLGTLPLAAMNVIMTLNSVAFMPAFGLSSAGAILVGQAIGRGVKDQVSAIVWRTARVTMAWQCTVGLLYFLVPGPLLALFAPQGDAGALVRVGAGMLALSGLWQLFDALGLTFGEALRAAGDTTWCMWARLVVAWLVFMPVAYWVVTVRGGGPIGAVASIVFYIVCLAALLVLRFRSGAWKRIQLTEPEPAVA